MVMGGGLSVGCGTSRGTKLASWVGCCFAITSSFLSSYNKNSSSDWGWLQKRSLAPLRDYKSNKEGRVAVVPKAVTLPGEEVSKALGMYGDLPLE